jgi:2-iminoacetate synthase
MPNACLTLTEYLEDYASEETSVLGFKVIKKKMEDMENNKVKEQLQEKLDRVLANERDLFF